MHLDFGAGSWDCTDLDFFIARLLDYGMKIA